MSNAVGYCIADETNHNNNNANNKGKDMNNSQAKNAIEKATGTQIKLSAWLCDDHYEGMAEAYANCTKEKYHTGYTKWNGDIVEVGESWCEKTRSKSNAVALMSLATKFGLHEIANKLQETQDKIYQAELNAYCHVTDL